MKKLLAYISLFAITLVLSLAASNVPQVLATSTFTEARSSITGINGVSTSTLPFNNVTNNATTSRSYITTTTATTTLTANVGSADEVWMYLHVVASSTNSTFRWTVEYSLDNADYFGEDTLVASTTVDGSFNSTRFTEHSTSTPVHRWQPGITSTTTKMIKLPNGVGNYIRVGFSMLGGNGSYWADIIPKRNTN